MSIYAALLLQSAQVLDMRAEDEEEITVTGTAIGLTAAKCATAEIVLVRFEAGPMRFRLKGDTLLPTGAAGWPAYDGYEMFLSSPSATLLRVIRNGSTNGLLRGLYFKR